MAARDSVAGTDHLRFSVSLPVSLLQQSAPCFVAFAPGLRTGDALLYVGEHRACHCLQPPRSVLGADARAVPGGQWNQLPIRRGLTEIRTISFSRFDAR